MHNWGDEGVDWAGIDAAAQFIEDYCAFWGRLGGQSKEKYGTVRFYARFGLLSLHTLVYPKYYFYRFPMWLRHLDYKFIGPVLRFFFERPFCYWQRVVYRKAYQRALAKWPHLRDEILDCADYDELLRGL